MKKFKAPAYMTRDFRNGHNCGWFFIPTYRHNIYLLWPVTPEQVNAFIKSEFKVHSTEEAPFGAKCTEILEKDGTAYADVISLSEWSGDEFEHGALAHEAFHAAEHILGNRGLRLSKETAEAYAYLIQEIVDRSLQLIRGKPQ